MDENLRRNARRIYEKEHGKLKEDMHVHHIVPWQLGGTNDIKNLIAVSIEDHYKIHHMRYLLLGMDLDLSACALLSNNFLKLSKEERRKVAAIGGKNAQKTLKSLKISAFYDPKTRKEISSKGGKNGAFQVKCIMRRGFTEDESRLILSKEQSKRGKLGGSKSKGFLWYNDGKNDYKYTSSMQKNKNFEDFVKDSEYHKGRVRRCIVSNGKIRKSILLSERDTFLVNNPSFKKSKRTKFK